MLLKFKLHKVPLEVALFLYADYYGKDLHGNEAVLE